MTWLSITKSRYHKVNGVSGTQMQQPYVVIFIGRILSTIPWDHFLVDEYEGTRCASPMNQGKRCTTALTDQHTS